MRSVGKEEGDNLLEEGREILKSKVNFTVRVKFPAVLP